MGRIKLLLAQLSALASELAKAAGTDRPQSRNSSKAPSSDGLGLPLRGGRQQGQHGSGPQLLPIERLAAVHGPSSPAPSGE